MFEHKVFHHFSRKKTFLAFTAFDILNFSCMVGNIMSDEFPRFTSRSTQTPQLEIPESSSSELVVFTEQNRSGNLIARVAHLEKSHKELSVTVNVLLSEVAKVKKDTLKNKKDQ